MELAVNDLISRNRGAQRFTVHAYSILYNVTRGQIPSQYVEQCMAWFQEIKRDLIFRRYKRCTGRIIQPNADRLCGYLILSINKIISLRKYQGRNNEGLTVILDWLKQRI